MPVSSFSYAIPYLLVFLVLTVLCNYEFRLLEHNRATTRVRWMTFGLLWFFIGFRGFVFTDFISYYPWFEGLPSLWTGNTLSTIDSDVETAFEPGFVLYAILCKSVIPNYFAWNITSAFIDLFILDRIFRRYSRYYALSFLIFFVMGCAVLEFNILRNAKAILIFLLALPYLKQRKPWKYFGMILLATMFHVSSLLYFPLYFFLHRRWPKVVLLGILLVGIAVTAGHIKFLFPILNALGGIIGGRARALIEIYLNSDLYAQPYSLGIGYLERIITYLLVFFTYGKWQDRTGDRYLFPNLYVLFFISFTCLWELGVALERISYLFMASYWIFYPQLLAYCRTLGLKLALFLYIFVLFGLKLTQQTSNIHLKYDNILFGIASFDTRKSVVKATLET